MNPNIASHLPVPPTSLVPNFALAFEREETQEGLLLYFTTQSFSSAHLFFLHHIASERANSPSLLVVVGPDSRSSPAVDIDRDLDRKTFLAAVYGLRLLFSSAIP